MTHSPPVPPWDDEDKERKFDAARTQRERQIGQLRARIHQSRPPRLYTRITITTGVLAALDWVAVGFHTGRGRAADSMIGAHQALVATLSIVAACLCIGWVVMYEQCRRERQRDEIDALRHQDLQTMIEWAAGRASQREWAAYAVGVREGQQGRRTIDAPTEPLNPVVPFSQRAAPSRNPGHRYSG